MPTREQKAQACKVWQVFLEGKRLMVTKVRKDLAALCKEKGFVLADTGSRVATLCLKDAGDF